MRPRTRMAGVLATGEWAPMGTSRAETEVEPDEHSRSISSKPRLWEEQETGATGLEPAASGVTGRRSNQLSYAPDALRFYAPPAPTRSRIGSRAG